MSKFILELYVKDESSGCREAIECVKDICDTYLNDRYTLEIIYVHKDPARAEQAKILTTPTLIKVSPEPVRRLIGGLKVKSRIIAGLDIPFAGFLQE